MIFEKFSKIYLGLLVHSLSSICLVLTSSDATDQTPTMIYLAGYISSWTNATDQSHDQENDTLFFQELKFDKTDGEEQDFPWKLSAVKIWNSSMNIFDDDEQKNTFFTNQEPSVEGMKALNIRADKLDKNDLFSLRENHYGNRIPDVIHTQGKEGEEERTWSLEVPFEYDDGDLMGTPLIFWDNHSEIQPSQVYHPVAVISGPCSENRFEMEKIRLDVYWGELGLTEDHRPVEKYSGIGMKGELENDGLKSIEIGEFSYSVSPLGVIGEGDMELIKEKWWGIESEGKKKEEKLKTEREIKIQELEKSVQDFEDLLTENNEKDNNHPVLETKKTIEILKEVLQDREKNVDVKSLENLNEMIGNLKGVLETKQTIEQKLTILGEGINEIEARINSLSTFRNDKISELTDQLATIETKAKGKKDFDIGSLNNLRSDILNSPAVDDEIPQEQLTELKEELSSVQKKLTEEMKGFDEDSLSNLATILNNKKSSVESFLNKTSELIDKSSMLKDLEEFLTKKENARKDLIASTNIALEDIKEGLEKSKTDENTSLEEIENYLSKTKENFIKEINKHNGGINSLNEKIQEIKDSVVAKKEHDDEDDLDLGRTREEITEMEDSFRELETTLTNSFDGLNNKFQNVNESLQKLESGLEAQMNKLEERVKSLEEDLKNKVNDTLQPEKTVQTADYNKPFRKPLGNLPPLKQLDLTGASDVGHSNLKDHPKPGPGNLRSLFSDNFPVVDRSESTSSFNSSVDDFEDEEDAPVPPNLEDEEDTPVPPNQSGDQGIDTSVPSPGNTGTSQSQGNTVPSSKGKKMSPWYYVLIFGGAAVVLVGIIVVVCLVRRKKGSVSNKKAGWVGD